MTKIHKGSPVLSDEDQKIQRQIMLRANRSMLILNRALRRVSGRPIGMHLDMRPNEVIQELSHMK